jgi:diguanylate cyclase (GGDEF)-like protein/PAS domain S-box-containing protein
MQNDALRKTQLELDRERERYFDLYNLAPVGYLTLSAGGLVLEANLTAATMLGVTRADLIMQPMTRFIYSEDQDIYYLYRKKFFNSEENQSCELRLMDKNHYHRWASLIALTLQDSKGNHIVRLILVDINEQKIYENELNRIAQHDALTNLPNRILLSDRLQQGMARSQRNGLHLAVVYLDLDGFKGVNDAYGHETGDQVLIAIAHRMTDVLREGDTIARLGGDEFVVILHDLFRVEDVIPLLNRFLETIAQPILVDELSLQVSASLGVSFYPQVTEVDTDVLLRQADQAMYQAKLAGRNRYHFFDAVQDSVLREHYEMIEQIEQALNACEFELYYQPKVNMRTGEIIGVEALIRWQHPDRGLLQPAEFLPIIEDHELSVRLGDWVMNQALNQMAQWQEAGIILNVSVKVTARQ